jgi:hypothetical protein
MLEPRELELLLNLLNVRLKHSSDFHVNTHTNLCVAAAAVIRTQ